MAKIVVIDDDKSICEMIQLFLGHHGHEVVVAHDGPAGLKAVAELPDLVICDLNMPSVNGQDVLRALRQDKRMEDVPFIFFSGTANRAQVRQSMNLGGDDFLTKPAEPSEILEAVNSRLARRTRQQKRTEEEVHKAVQIFSGIVDDLGSSKAAMHWLSEAVANEGTKLSAEPGKKMEPPAKTPPPSFLAVKDNRRYFVQLSEVKVLLADGEYSRAFWGKDQNMMFRKPLKQWEEELPANQFVRVHRKAIINLAFLDFVSKTKSGMPQVHLNDFAETIEVSQRKVATLNRCLKEHCHVPKAGV